MTLIMSSSYYNHSPKASTLRNAAFGNTSIFLRKEPRVGKGAKGSQSFLTLPLAATKVEHSVLPPAMDYPLRFMDIMEENPRGYCR